MSGFVGIVHLDGAPADARLLQRMTRAMAFRGPDGQHTWLDGPAAFGHALLRTKPDDVVQPFTLDGRTVIVGDLRLDARADLVTALRDSGEAATTGSPDAELVLRAWRAWGERCADHLLGDFAFAIWDAPRRRLFCARDHLGVKSFFYALRGRTLVFGNTLDCVRMHPGVSDALDDLAIADFLLFELNQDPASTVFADVRRLPPAHTAVLGARGFETRRYWSLPADEPVFYRRAADYVDRFDELLEAAVSDRMRGQPVGIFMSGGIDSPALAATAARLARAEGRDAAGVRAFTTTVEGLDRDEERYARLVADQLGIPISLTAWASAFDHDWHRSHLQMPSPVRGVMTLEGDRRLYGRIAAHSRVCFYGEGPDNALQYEWQPYLRYLRDTRRYGRLAGDVGRHVMSHRRLPLQSLVARLARRRRERGRWDARYPAWVNPSLERRFGLRERWERYQHLQAPPVVHPVRPAAHASFCGPEWEALFRGFDPEETRAPLDVRHPYVDLRLLRYLLAVPPVPWCRSKFLIRRAMRHVLPAAVLRRRKSGLASDPDYEIVRRVGLPALAADERLTHFVDTARVPGVEGSGMIDFRTDFRPRALNCWLTNLTGAGHPLHEENEHDIAIA